MKKRIGILIVDDSVFVRDVLQSMFSEYDDMQVLGVATNGHEAVAACKELRPDLITMDIDMPECDGLEATEVIMSECPTPILILSSKLNQTHITSSFACIQRGALDTMEKPDVQNEARFRAQADLLIDKIRLLHRIPVIRHIRGPSAHRLARPQSKTEAPRPRVPSVVLIGASTGGPKVLHEILSHLRRGLQCGIVIVQHISPGFIQGMITWLRADCKMPIRVAEQDERIRPGVVYFAPDNTHCTLQPGGAFALRDQVTQWDHHRPSINHLFASAAESFRDQCLAVLLTGMGRDGAEGLLAVKEAGGTTVVQDEKSSLIWGMPKAALDLGAAQHTLTPEEIAQMLNQFAGSGGK